MTALAIFAVAFAVTPLCWALVNLFFFRRPGPLGEPERDPPFVSVLVPARNERDNAARLLDQVLASQGVRLEIIVYDDASEDDTAAIVRTRAERDDRVHLLSGTGPPPGWSGKQHACTALARSASADELLFVDADVSLEPDAVARLVNARRAWRVDLLSGFPRQVTGSLLERLVMPLIELVLVGYLPFPAMRWSRHPAFGAGCGQVMLASRHGYESSGGHAGLRHSRHDGLLLPRAFRRAGLATDACDLQDLARVRSYRSAKEVWNGLAKNAREGLATPVGRWVWTALLLGGHVLPVALVGIGLAGGLTAEAMRLALLATAAGFTLRALLAIRFRQPWSGVFLHPVGVLLLVAIQWHAVLRGARGFPWKGRQPAVGVTRPESRARSPR